jgi:hypothetical protein
MTPGRLVALDLCQAAGFGGGQNLFYQRSDIDDESHALIAELSRPGKASRARKRLAEGLNDDVALADELVHDET